MRLSFLLLLSLLLSCSVEGRRTTFPLELSADLPTAANEHGWTVTLSRAQVSVGPVRFFEGEVLLSRRSVWDWVYPSAHAHPGHYVPGAARGEWSGVATLDLLSGKQAVGEVSATTGPCGSGELSLPPATAASDPQNSLGGASVRLEGVAERSGETVTFAVSLPVTERIQAIRFQHFVEEGPGGVEVAIRLSRWFERMDFSTAAPPGTDGVSPLPEGSQALNALIRGIADPAGYRFTWVPTE